MGFLQRARELYNKSVRTNPIFSMNVKKKESRGIPKKERAEIGGVGAEAKEETIAEVGDYELRAPVWKFDRFEDPDEKRKRRRQKKK